MTKSQIQDPRGAHISSAAGKSEEAPVRDSPAQPYPGEKARQGRIVLDTPLRRTIFFAGLIAFVILTLALVFAG